MKAQGKQPTQRLRGRDTEGNFSGIDVSSRVAARSSKTENKIEQEEKHAFFILLDYEPARPSY